MKTDGHKYDVALSYASEDRKFVYKVAEHLRANGLKVFYDKFEELALWGEDLGDILNKIYGAQSQYVIIFISRHYAQKMWPNHELKIALSRAILEERAFVLPARFDDTKLEGLKPTIAYINLEEETSESFAAKIIEKVKALHPPSDSSLSAEVTDIKALNREGEAPPPASPIRFNKYLPAGAVLLLTIVIAIAALLYSRAAGTGSLNRAQQDANANSNSPQQTVSQGETKGEAEKSPQATQTTEPPVKTTPRETPQVTPSTQAPAGNPTPTPTPQANPPAALYDSVRFTVSVRDQNGVAWRNLGVILTDFTQDVDSRGVLYTGKNGQVTFPDVPCGIKLRLLIDLGGGEAEGPWDFALSCQNQDQSKSVTVPR